MDLKTKLGLKDSWWARFIRPFASLLADWRERRKARRQLKQYAIWGYTATWRGKGHDLVVVQALVNGEGKRKVKTISGFLWADGNRKIRVALKAWLAGDSSADGFFRKGVDEVFAEVKRKSDEK